MNALFLSTPISDGHLTDTVEIMNSLGYTIVKSQLTHDKMHVIFFRAAVSCREIKKLARSYSKKILSSKKKEKEIVRENIIDKIRNKIFRKKS